MSYKGQGLLEMVLALNLSIAIYPGMVRSVSLSVKQDNTVC